MPKVPWRVGRVVNIGPLTSLFYVHRPGRRVLGTSWGIRGVYAGDLLLPLPGGLSILPRPFLPASGTPHPARAAGREEAAVGDGPVPLG
ncbi:hypothetical protein GCM10010451_14950 [Streptomyces virens]|uniref:Uncharacterized protein n=1 Tax=Streptomyces virens TaxID=285572 RepID=A0ABP6P4R2_9ACTN